MSRDFPIRIDLAKLGIPERTIRVLEKAALLKVADVIAAVRVRQACFVAVTKENGPSMLHK